VNASGWKAKRSARAIAFPTSPVRNLALDRGTDEFGQGHSRHGGGAAKLFALLERQANPDRFELLSLCHWHNRV
jgi:hypothetical protein